MNRVFISDCEGPISKNDNAFEAATFFVPNGDRLFALLSKFDDVLADVVRKRGYNAGDTLKLILPFLKAYGVTDESLNNLSKENLRLIAGSKKTLDHVKSLTDSFIVSTSYEHYIRALCTAVSFPFENTYCTRLSLNKYALSESESIRLRELAQEIARKPMVTIPFSAKSLENFSKQDRETVRRLDEIFWEEISTMSAGVLLKEITPIGGIQKAEAAKVAAEKSRVELSDVFYVGDSITDMEAFKLIREKGGLTLSFNGNQYAVRNSDVAVLSENNTVIAVIAELWGKFGKRETLEILKDWSPSTLQQSGLSKTVLEQLFISCNSELPNLQIVTPQNMESLASESEEFRKKVRGEAIGRLG